MASNKITIITVVFNGEETIEQTILSVCNQTLLPLEYIIIDGNSTDNTLSIVKSFASKYNFIKWISEGDNGIYDAMNKGIKMASGEIIGIINSDDWYELNALKEIDESYSQYGSGIYYGLQRTIRLEKEVNIIRNSHLNIREIMICHPSTFITKDIYENFGLFNLKYKYSADLELFLRYTKYDLLYIPINSILANFRLGGASSSVGAAYETICLRKKYGTISSFKFLYKSLKLLIIKYFG